MLAAAIGSLIVGVTVLWTAAVVKALVHRPKLNDLMDGDGRIVDSNDPPPTRGAVSLSYSKSSRQRQAVAPDTTTTLGGSSGGGSANT